MTAPQQIDDGFDDDAASTLLKLQCAKTKLAASRAPSVQIKQIGDHLNSAEDDIEHKTTLLHETKKQLDELQTTRKQLTNVLHDLRDEPSDTSDADDEAESPRPRPTTPRSATRSATPRPRRHMGTRRRGIT